MTNAEHIARLKVSLFDLAAQLLVAENCSGIAYSVPGTAPERLVLIGEVATLARFLEIRAGKDEL